MGRGVDCVSCRACSSEALIEVFRAMGVPVENSRLYDDQDAALAAPTGDLVLSRCEHCGFVQNDAFEPDAVTYDDAYEDSQAHSPYFRSFADRIIAELLDRYDLRGKRALEIGCGRGDFLKMYCEASGGTGIGIDPSSTREVGHHGDVEIRAEAFDSTSWHHDADVVICRHTLEHVQEPADFLCNMRRAFEGRPDTVLYLEVPDTARIATEGAFWDLYYEHCCYFDADSLTALARQTGWEPLECRLDYGGQYLVLHAQPGSPVASTGRTSKQLDFDRVNSSEEAWRTWSAVQAMNDRSVAIWAASSKSVAFLSLVPKLANVVVTDINPAKAGRYLPANGFVVHAPEELASHGIETVLVMNPVYVREIQAELSARGLHPKIVPLVREPPQLPT